MHEHNCQSELSFFSMHVDEMDIDVVVASSITGFPRRYSVFLRGNAGEDNTSGKKS